MKNKYRIGIACLLTMFMALIYSSMALAANELAIDSQFCSTAGGNVIFTISINNAPNEISAFGLTISYNESILEFVKFDGKKGDLADFMISAGKQKDQAVIKVGGYYTGSETVGLAAGASCKIGALEFKVKSCESATLAIAGLTDDVKTWTPQAGQLVAPVLHAPVLEPIGNKVVMLGDSVSFTAQAEDEDKDAISYSIADSPVGAYFGTQNGEFNWTPNPGQAATYSVTITATDSTGKSDSETIQITVNEPHAPVVAAIAKQTVMAMSTLSLTAQATDVDGDAITYSIANAPAGATFNTQTGNLVWTPTQAQVGSYSVTITATDTTGRSGSATATIEVVLASMTMNNQSCRGAGEDVTFTISVNGAPNEVHSLGFEVSYDENILEYKSNSRGDLTQGFELLGVSKLTSKPNTLKVGGVGAANGIAQGSSGTILNLVFGVKSCVPAVFDLAKLDDDVDGWSVKSGQLSVAPPIVCPGNILVEATGANGTSAGNSAIQAFLNGAAVHDAMGYPLAVTTNAPAVFALGTTEVTFSTVYGAGNSTSCQATVRVVDSLAPVITCPAGITVEAEDENGASAASAAIQAFLKAVAATDAVGVVSVTTNAPAIFPLGTTNVTFTVADAAGNKNSCTSSVTVADKGAPVISCPGPITVAAESANGTSAGNSQITGFLKAAVATDSIDGMVAVINDAPAVFALGKTVVTFTTTDKAGNSASCTATLTVVDTVPPVITCPGNITVGAEGVNGVSDGNAAIQALLNGAIAIDAIDGQVSVTNNAPAVFTVGTTEVTFTATDKSGNKKTCTASVTVVDTVPPVITCPANMTVTAEGPNGASANSAAIQAFLNGATATDNVDGSVNVINDGPDSFGIGKTDVTFSATDKSGNTSTCTATVTVLDNTAPVITCPANLNLEAEGPDGVPVNRSAIQAFLNSATATDIEDGAVNVINNAPATFVLGNTVVTFSAKDGVGNLATCTATVTVVDSTDPVITCPGSITVGAEGSHGVSATNAAIQAFLKAATATDAIDGKVDVSNNAPAVFAIGNTNVTFSASDTSVNMDSCTATVTVTDTVDPVITCPVDITVEAEGSDGTSVGNDAIQAFLSGAAATDNVDGSVTVTNNAPAMFGLGDTSVIFYAADTALNTSSCTAIVSVVDKTGPAINCPANITVAAEGPNGTPASSAAIQAFLKGVTATDNVDGSVTVTNNAPAMFAFGDTVVNFSAKDKSGNLSTCTATIKIGDTTPPVITCPASITVSASSADGVTATVFAIRKFLSEAKATDALDGTVTVTNNAPAKFSVGKTEVTFIATDKSGNTSTCKATVTVTMSAAYSTGGNLYYSGSSNLFGSSLSGTGTGLYSNGFFGLTGLTLPLSSNLYQPFNQNLYNFQNQSWNLYQLTTPSWSTTSWSPTTWSLF